MRYTSAVSELWYSNYEWDKPFSCSAKQRKYKFNCDCIRYELLSFAANTQIHQQLYSKKKYIPRHFYLLVAKVKLQSPFSKLFFLLVDNVLLQNPFYTLCSLLLYEHIIVKLFVGYSSAHMALWSAILNNILWVKDGMHVIFL